MNQIINNKIRSSFPPSTKVVGAIFLGLGLFALLGNIIIGLIFIIVGAIIVFSYQGIRIDPKSKRIKEYTNYAGIGLLSGKWEMYTDYPFISILRKNLKATSHSRANTALITSDETVHDIVLLNESHRKKIIVKRCRGKEQAIKEEFLLSEKMGVERVAYNPVVSERTRGRRR